MRRRKAGAVAGQLLQCDVWRRAFSIFCNKIKQINELRGSLGILTWLYVVSMVRAAFEGERGVTSINRRWVRVSTS